MRNIKLYTTPTIEGTPIEAYYGLITANQVAGTGFLTDLTASFSDLFGGNSGAYRNEMTRLYSDVIDNLSQQASALGGNAIVGVRVDFDNISAKNMSMFMVSIQGTAVKLKETEKKADTDSDVVTWDYLECELKKRLLERKLKNDEYLTQEEWQYILTHNMPELAELLYNLYDRTPNGYADENGEICKKNFPIYVSKLSYEQAVTLMYKKDSCYYPIIKKLYLFNAKKILEYTKQEEKLPLVCKLLNADKPTYGMGDLEDMKELARYLQDLPHTGRLDEVKGGLFSSGGIKFICQCGAKNDQEQKFCSVCNKDITGLTEAQRNSVDTYIEKVSILEEILRKKKHT